MLVKAGSGVMTAGVPDSAGVPAGCTQDTLSAVYNDLSSVESLFQQFGGGDRRSDRGACGSEHGRGAPRKGLSGRPSPICDQYKSVLIFDEVITGFRLGIDGAQGYFGVKADLTTFGKIIEQECRWALMEADARLWRWLHRWGTVYQAGTLSGNPVAMAAGLTQLQILRDQPEIYRELNAAGDWFFSNR